MHRDHRTEESTKPTRAFSKVQEIAVAKRFNGNRTPNSGATTFQPGDVKTQKFLLECKTKTTHSDSLSIKKEWLEKLESEAVFSGKPYEALVFNFGPQEKNYVIINENLFLELLSYLETTD